MNKRKRIGISIVVLLLVIAGTIAILYVTKSLPGVNKSSFDPTGPAQAGVVFSPDLSKDYGACSVVQKEFITQSLASFVSDVQGPDNLGRVQIGKGDDSQICAYGFADATAENMFSVDNGLSIQVYVYRDQAAVDAAIAVPYQGSESVSGLGDTASFVTINDSSTALTKQVLIVFAGQKHYKYTITEPTETALIDAIAAKTALIEIANNSIF